MGRKRKAAQLDELKKAPPPPVKEESEEEEEEEEEEEVEDSSEEEEVEDSSEEVEEEGEEVEQESESEDDETKKEHIRELLQPFPKEKLIEILKEAATSNQSIFKQIVEAADANPIHRKIFVHGLSWETTTETVSEAFRQFGKIEECIVVTDKATGKSKGYGFVLFKRRSGAAKALKKPEKLIGGRMTACQLASAGPAAVNAANGSAPVRSVQVFDSGASRKLHVKNVGPQVSVEKLKSFFSKFGEIEQGPLGVDKVTGKLRGFAIFVYKTVEGINKALEEPVKDFEGLKLECSVAKEGKYNKNFGNASITVENINVGSLIASNGQSSAAAPVMPQFPYGLSPAMLGAGFYMNQNPGMGVMNPFLGMHGAMNPVGLPASYMGGMVQGAGRGTVPPVVSSAGFGMQQGVNVVSPSVIASYGSQAALQGSRAFQNPQAGQSSANAKEGKLTSGLGVGHLSYGR